MYTHDLETQLKAPLEEIYETGLYQRERSIESTKSSTVTLKDSPEAINMRVKNYLGSIYLWGTDFAPSVGRKTYAFLGGMKVTVLDPS